MSQFAEYDMESVPRAVATGSQSMSQIRITRIVTRSPPLSVLTSMDNIMIRFKGARALVSPRSGRSENSPALQCWVQGCCFPSDKSLGYFQPSAVRTILKTLTLICLGLFFFANASVFAQVPASSIPSPTPDQAVTVPTVATGFHANAGKPLPPLTRVGVDLSEQKPLTMREAITMALQNNKDIEVARDNVSIAEADLLTAHGAYDPRLSAQSYFERIKTPAASFLSGASGAVETSDFTNTGRLEGLAPKFGGIYRVDFSSIRQTSNSQFTALNPQYPTALTFSFTQPLARGLRFDLPRRQIEVAKKNLSLTDAQFRQRAIEVITSVQRTYWDLVFALRNLQIQRDSLT